MSQDNKVAEHPKKPMGVDGQGMFDNRVKIYNETSGKLIGYQPYAIHQFGDRRMYERPIGSGNMFDDHGQAIGRYSQKVENKEVSWIKLSDEHLEVQATALNKEDALQDALEAAQAEIAALKAEKAKVQPAIESTKGIKKN